MDAEAVLGQLCGLGHRITPQRKLVVEVILGSPCLQTAEVIYRKCRERDESISYPTIYRTLDMLVTAKILRKVYLGDNRARYELVGAGEHRHRLLCCQCGAKVPIDCPRQHIAQEACRNHFVVLDHQLEIMGICQECQKSGQEVRG